MTSNTTNTLHSVSFVNSLTGWCVGADGIILKTTTGGITSIRKQNSPIPNLFSLHQNFPNPFNPTTKIDFDLPRQSNVRLLVYDVLGKEVSELVNEKLQPGKYSYEWNASPYLSGVYYYKLIAGEFSQTRKTVLIR
jgi:hypothetical protein